MVICSCFYWSTRYPLDHSQIIPDHMIIRFYTNLWSLCSSSAAIIRAKGGHIEYKIYEELLWALQKWKVERLICLKEYNHHLQTTGCRMSHFDVRAQKITSLWASHADRHNVIRARLRVRCATWTLSTVTKSDCQQSVITQEPGKTSMPFSLPQNHNSTE